MTTGITVISHPQPQSPPFPIRTSTGLAVLLDIDLPSRAVINKSYHNINPCPQSIEVDNKLYWYGGTSDGVAHYSTDSLSYYSYPL